MEWRNVSSKHRHPPELLWHPPVGIAGCLGERQHKGSPIPTSHPQVQDVPSAACLGREEKEGICLKSG